MRRLCGTISIECYDEPGYVTVRAIDGQDALGLHFVGDDQIEGAELLDVCLQWAPAPMEHDPSAASHRYVQGWGGAPGRFDRASEVVVEIIAPRVRGTPECGAINEPSSRPWHSFELREVTDRRFLCVTYPGRCSVT